MSGLTDEQRQRMEENKRRALEKLSSKNSSSLPSSPPVKRPCPDLTSSSPSSSGAKASFRQNGTSFYSNNSNSKSSSNIDHPARSVVDGNSSTSCGNHDFSRFSYKNSNSSPSNNKDGCGTSSNNNSISSNSNSSTSNTVTLSQREKALENKNRAMEKLKQKNTTAVPTSPSSTNSYPKNYCSPPKTELKNSVKIDLTFAMKDSTWFRMDYNYRHREAIKNVVQKIDRRKMSDGAWCFHIQDYQSVVKTFSEHLNVTVKHIPEKVVRILQEAHKRSNGVVSSTEDDVDLSPIGEEIASKLMDFQREGIIFGIRRKGRFLIADDMGLGKTVQAICLCAYYRTDWPVLVICPSSVKMSWKQHFISWLPDVEDKDINIVNTGKDKPTTGQINIISYDLAAKHVADLFRKAFRIIIADECHFLKNHAAVRTKNIVPLLQGTKRAILLSGTPALSRPKELFTQIKALDKTLFPKYQEFSERYCAGHQAAFGWDDNGCSNDAELQAVLRGTLMVRRMKDEVLHQLPEKRRQIVLLDPTMIKNSKLLASEERSFKNAKQDRRSALLSYFKRTCEAKVKGVCEYISEKIDCGVKMIIFAHHLDMLEAVEQLAIKKKTEYIRIDGSSSHKTRQAQVDVFNNESRCLLAILSLTACGTGLNIVGSSNIVFAELFWNPGHLKQAEDRAYRIGQKNCVLVTYLVANGTADDYIWPMVQTKLRILTSLGVGTARGFEGQTTKHEDHRQKSMIDFFDQLIEEDDKELCAEVEKMAEDTKSQESKKGSNQTKNDNDAVTSSAASGTGGDSIGSDFFHSKDSIVEQMSKDSIADVPDDLLKDSLSDDLIKDCVGGVDDLIKDCVSGVDDLIKDCTSGVDDLIKDCTSGVDDLIKDCTSGVDDLIKDCTSGVDDLIKDCTSGVDDLIKDCVGGDLLNDSIPDDLVLSSDPLDLKEWMSDDVSTQDENSEPVPKRSKIS